MHWSDAIVYKPWGLSSENSSLYIVYKTTARKMGNWADIHNNLFIFYSNEYDINLILDKSFATFEKKLFTSDIITFGFEFHLVII